MPVRAVVPEGLVAQGGGVAVAVVAGRQVRPAGAGSAAGYCGEPVGLVVAVAGGGGGACGAVGAAQGMAGGIKATRATSWLAGRMWTGLGSRSTPVGRISANGLRQYRSPTHKQKLGRVQSNFESRPAKGKWPNNFHVDIR